MHNKYGGIQNGGFSRWFRNMRVYAALVPKKAVLWVLGAVVVGILAFFSIQKVISVSRKVDVGAVRLGNGKIVKQTIIFSEHTPEKGERVISRFEDATWKGQYSADDTKYRDGEGSYKLVSEKGKAIILSKDVSLFMGSDELLKLLYYIENDEAAGQLQALQIMLTDKDGATMTATVKAFKKQWNVLKFSKTMFVQHELYQGQTFAWTSIVNVMITAVSKSTGTATVYLDKLWLEKPYEFKNQFLSTNYDNLTFMTKETGTYPMLWNVGTFYAAIKDFSSVSDATFTVGMMPVRKGPFGIFVRGATSGGYGYHLIMDGIDTNSWRLMRFGKKIGDASWIVLKQGTIENFMMKKDTPYWLRVVTKGTKISAYLSLDGTVFTKLTETTHKEFSSGSVGVMTHDGSVVLQKAEIQ